MIFHEHALIDSKFLTMPQTSVRPGWTGGSQLYWIDYKPNVL